GRTESAEALLQGGRALIRASGDVDRDEFERYVTGLHLDKHFPGMQGIGFTAMVTPGQRVEMVTRARAGGVPDFEAWRAGEREQLSIVLYFEPLDERSR